MNDRSAHSPLPVVEVVRATVEDEPVLANLLELYAHDFSELIDLTLGPNGRFGYPRLALYWREEDRRFAFLLRADDQLAGFALVTRGSEISGDPDVWDMSEFFVARGLRKRGIGAAAAHEVWRRFPGRWEIRVMEKNLAARAFWAAAVAGFIHAPAVAFFAETEDQRWEVFSFRSGSE